MNTWEDWSDEQINAAVTCEVCGLQGWDFSDNMQQFYHCGIDGSETHTQPVIDFCNNPADMWPLIVENSITIDYDTCQAHASSYFAPAIKVSVTKSKTLRAAAIVYLEMNGVKP